MKKIITYFVGALLFAGTTASAQNQARNEMLLNAVSFINTPYGVKTLDMNNEEQLVLNTDEVDCVTLVENVLAMSLAEDSQTMAVNEQDFTRWLTKIRYRKASSNRVVGKEYISAMVAMPEVFCAGTSYL